MKKTTYFKLFILIISFGVLGYLMSYPFDIKLQIVIISVFFLAYLKYFLYLEKKTTQNKNKNNEQK